MQISKNWECGADLFVEIQLLFADPQDSTVCIVPGTIFEQKTLWTSSIMFPLGCVSLLVVWALPALISLSLPLDHQMWRRVPAF